MRERRTARAIRADIKSKRILVTSDVHGSLRLFRELLDKMSYRPGEDALVIAGDLVQKGPENLGVLRLVMELSKEENVFVLLGNNDFFVEDGTDENIFNHTAWFRERSLLGEMALLSGLPLPETVEETAALRKKMKEAFPKEHAFLRSLPQILETDRFLFAHAGLESEALDAQELDYVVAVPRFHEVVSHVFSKLLLVGHWPTANFRTDRLSNTPLYNEAHNVLSIDGGNTVKRVSQLNGVILDNETGEWDWTSVDSFPKIKAPRSQKAVPGTVIVWPDNYVEILERGQAFTHCRAKRNGAVLDIPNDFLYKDGESFRTSDITSARLEVERGEPVSLIWEDSKRMLIMKNGETGYLLL